MLPANQVAFKEWAVVCAALAAGRQTIILRKGGIAEGRDGFRVAHNECWLLPTQFHQHASQLIPEAEPLWHVVCKAAPPAGKFLVVLYATVQDVLEVRDFQLLQRLDGQHILSDETVQQRFNYRNPGLFVLVVRIFRAPQRFEIDDSPYIAGCKSWVELPRPLPTAGLVPVLDDATFQDRLDRVRDALSR